MSPSAPTKSLKWADLVPVAAAAGAGFGGSGGGLGDGGGGGGLGFGGGGGGGLGDGGGGGGLGLGDGGGLGEGGEGLGGGPGGIVSTHVVGRTGLPHVLLARVMTVNKGQGLATNARVPTMESETTDPVASIT